MAYPSKKAAYPSEKAVLRGNLGAYPSKKAAYPSEKAVLRSNLGYLAGGVQIHVSGVRLHVGGVRPGLRRHTLLVRILGPQAESGPVRPDPEVNIQ